MGSQKVGHDWATLTYSKKKKNVTHTQKKKKKMQSTETNSKMIDLGDVIRWWIRLCVLDTEPVSRLLKKNW